MRRVHLGTLFAVALALIVAVDQPPAQAGVISRTVSLDTSVLSGPFELAFIFTDGSADPMTGIGDGNNTVTLNNFLFGGGGAGAVDTSLSQGGVSGDLTSGASLVDSSFLNIFAAMFTPGNLLSFTLSLTTNLDLGGTPDQFSLALLQADGTPVNTQDPSGANSLLTVNIDSADPVFGTFPSDLTPAPIVTKPNPAPEPQSLLLFATGLAATLWTRKKRGKSFRTSAFNY